MYYLFCFLTIQFLAEAAFFTRFGQGSLKCHKKSVTAGAEKALRKCEADLGAGEAELQRGHCDVALPLGLV